MIFLSYNNQDRPLVDQLANNLAKVFGRDDIFYDGWSIQPGDGIIGKMNEGLSRCKFFFFIVTQRSLASNMVTLEWQNALMKSVAGECRFIPIKADQSIMPSIIMQNLYIDLSNYGIDVAVRQMIDVINGHSTYRPAQEFSNLRAKVSGDSKSLLIRVEATFYLEPISRFLIFLNNQESDFVDKVINEIVFPRTFVKDLDTVNGVLCSGLPVSATRGITPQYPLQISLTATGDTAIDFRGIFHRISDTQFRPIPVDWVS